MKRKEEHVCTCKSKTEIGLEKFRKKFRKSCKRLKKFSQKLLQVVQVKEKKKKFCYFPREQRLERGLRLPRVHLNSPQLLTNGPTTHRDSLHRQPSSQQMLSTSPQ